MHCLRMSVVLGWAATLTVALGCAKARPIANDTRGCDNPPIDWTDNLGPVFAQDCTSCHSGTTPAGSYDLSSYFGALGPGSDATPNAIAGNDASVLVQTLNPATADATHAPYTYLFPTVQKWVDQCQLAYSTNLVHARGILNPSSPDFHGVLVQQSGWNFGLCAQCHGQDFTGGAAGVSCFQCHARGPTDCSTCHPAMFPTPSPSADGAHAIHLLGGTLAKKLDCTECHVKPKQYTDVGHLFAADGSVIPPPARITFGALASTSTAARRGPPAFDPATGTCSNVYCHGDAFTDTAAKLNEPTWAPGGTGLTCDACHGFPPSNHGNNQCFLCHGQVIDASGSFVNPALHLDGVIELGDGSGTCSACHGDATSPAPPRDLEGDTLTTAIGVGAHRSHLEGRHALTAPLPCAACHQVPSQVTDSGHLDHPLPATLFPTAIASTSLAFADSAAPAWSHATATCTNVYCHGGGATLQANDPGLPRSPIWTDVGTGQAACGTCHHIPPQDGNPGHPAGAPLTTCVTCHPSTVDAYGNILVTSLPDGGFTSTHINGVIDVEVPDGG